MFLIQQLNQLRAQRPRRARAQEQAQEREEDLLRQYAHQNRRFADGVGLECQGQPAVVQGVVAIYTGADKQTLALSYGVYSPSGKPLDFLREDMLALAII